MAALSKKFSGKLYPRSGVVTTVTYDNSGPRQATVALGGGATERVNVAGMNGIEPGAEMELQYLDGSLVNTRVTRRVAAASGAPSQPLSTPVIDSVTTIVDMGAPGGETIAGRGMAGSVPSPLAQGIVLIRAIPEQLADVYVTYEVEIQRAATGALAWSETSNPRGLSRGLLSVALEDTDTSGDYLKFETWYGGWPAEYGLVTLGDLGTDESEHVWVQGPPMPIPSPGTGFGMPIAGGALADAYDVRGYNGAAFPEGYTSAQEWPIGTAVTLNSAALSFAGLAVDVAYQVRARARGVASGNVSNWSEWFDFTTATDTTAPDWSGDNTPTVTAAPGAFLVTWPPADDYAGGVVDLAYYELRHSPDGSTWTEVIVGQGTSYVLPGEPGETRYFAIRAVDTSGNASAWSPSASATMPSAGQPAGTQLLANPSFTTNTSDWALAFGTDVTLTRDAGVFCDTPGSARLDFFRDGGALTDHLDSQAYNSLGVVTSLMRAVYVRAYLRFSSTAATPGTDRASLTVRFYDASNALVGEVSKALDLYSGTNWRALSFVARVPSTATSARLRVTGELPITSTSPDNTALYVDNTALVLISDPYGAAVTEGSLSSAPGASAQPLATDSAGGVRLAQLAIGATGATLTGYLSASTAWNPASINSGASASTTVTVTGAVVGDPCIAGYASITSAGWLLSAQVTAADTVTVTLFNTTGIAVDLGSGTLRVGVFKH